MGILAALKGATLDCGESGSTLRFMLPVACALGADATFTGAERLGERPLGTSPRNSSPALRPRRARLLPPQDHGPSAPGALCAAR